ncbi:MAG: hypothetical protein LBK44_05510, partial [Spirochaetales bacterium]|nr:hypothetical protein [Spirochaetales bacterium]
MPAAGQKNRAFRSKSSESAGGAFLWAFRSNPSRSGSSAPSPGIAGRQFRGQVIAGRQFRGQVIAGRQFRGQVIAVG